jgi:hypothetical protein
MTLVDDIFSGGNWVTGLAIGVGAVIILPLAAPILRPLAKTAIKGGILAYRGGAGLVEGIGDLVAEIVAEDGEEVVEEAVEVAAEAADDAGRGAANAAGERVDFAEEHYPAAKAPAFEGSAIHRQHSTGSRSPSRATPNAHGGWRTSRVVASEVSAGSRRLVAAGLENGGHRFR